MNASSPLPAGPEVVDPAPDAFVLPFNRLRPGFDPGQLPRFRDLAWRLALISPRESNRSLVIDWSRCPAGLRPGIMRAAFAELNIPTPAVLLQQRASRSTTQPGTLRHNFQIWIRFATWLGGRGITELSRVTAGDLEAYAEHLRPLGRQWRTDAKALGVISRLWAYAPYLPEHDRLVMPPWEDPAAVMSDFLGANDDTPGGENAVAIVHPAVMAPLLVWALRMVLDLSPDILAAAREHRRLLAAIPDRAPRGGTETAVAHLRGLLAAGQQLPSSGAPGATAVRARFGGPLPPMANTFLAGTLGVTTSQVARARGLLTDELTPTDFGPAPLLDVPLTARIGAAPWRAAIGFDDVDVLMLHLSTAALICCAYLSGMRPEEVLALRRGCCTRVERDDGTVRFEIRGRHFKGVLDEDGNTIGEGEVRADPWIVLEPVARAIAVVEELEDGEQLFTRTLYRYAKGTCMPRTGLSPDTAVERIRAFTAWANQLAAAHDRPHELIPPDPDGAVALRRFRRTIAWFVYRQPGGRIALAVQYGHAATAMSESYAGRSKADMLEVLDQEKGLALAETLTEAGERLAAGEKVSGPAADRYRAAATEFSDRYAGTYLGRRELRALVANPRLQVYEDPKAFLTCNHDAFTALCNPDRDRARNGGRSTPDHSRCHPACANISRTDSQITALRTEVARIDADADAGLNPYPIAAREQQRKDHLTAIISRHDAQQPADSEPTERR
ncbi:integrase [Streptomyces aquilus]|uniref:Integrase n=1 Tax=Streptomyces aquilus TaxID=2548456 RepID=A0A3S9IEU4_9ACTN|nr:integrase [Streptomyces aquilus]AZP22898.1 integrase [Streptomyces aquilus]